MGIRGVVVAWMIQWLISVVEKLTHSLNIRGIPLNLCLSFGMRSNSPLQVWMVDLNWLNVLQLGAGKNGMSNSFVDFMQSIAQPSDATGMIGTVIFVGMLNDGISGSVARLR